MSSVCQKCTKTLTKTSPGLQCSGACGLSFHANSHCSDVAKNQLSVINIPGGRWLCQGCRSGDAGPRARAGSAADSPLDLAFSSLDDLRAPGFSDPAELPGLLKSIVHEIKLLRTSVEFCSDKISDFEKKLEKLNDYYKLTDTLNRENIILKKQISDLSYRVISLESHTRAKNVELQDIPEKNNENLINVVQKIGDHLRFRVDSSMLDTVFRVPSRSENKPKNIIIKFMSTINRDGFLAAAKALKSQPGNQKGLKIEGISAKFYINEHLAPQTKLLLKQAREQAKTKNIRFVWAQNGNVLARKSEDSKITQINNLDDLDQL